MKNQSNEEYILNGYKTYIQKMIEKQDIGKDTYSYSFFVATLGVIFGSAEAGKMAASWVKTGDISPLLLTLSSFSFLLGFSYIIKNYYHNNEDRIRYLQLFKESIEEVMKLGNVHTIYFDKDKTFYSSNLKYKMNKLLDIYDKKHFSLTLEYRKKKNIYLDDYDNLDNRILTMMMKNEIANKNKGKVKALNK